MELVYGHHARPRMRERRITESEVQAVIEAPEIDLPRRKGGHVYIGHPGGRFVKVVVATETNPLTIITVAD